MTDTFERLWKELEDAKRERDDARQALSIRYALAREIEEILGVRSAAASDEQLAIGVAAVKQIVRELEDAKRALGPAWLAGGTLAEGIARKTAALEAMNERPRSMRDARVVDDVLDERARQRELGHADAHDYPDGTAEVRRWVPLPGVDAVRELADERQTWALVLLEEVLEVLGEDDVDRLREELVQVAAVAIRWAGAIDGRKR